MQATSFRKKTLAATHESAREWCQAEEGYKNCQHCTSNRFVLCALLKEKASLHQQGPRATRVRALTGWWPGTDLRVCLKYRLQILCTKSLQEYLCPLESLSGFFSGPAEAFSLHLEVLWPQTSKTASAHENSNCVGSTAGAKMSLRYTASTNKKAQYSQIGNSIIEVRLFTSPSQSDLCWQNPNCSLFGPRRCVAVSSASAALRLCVTGV